MSSACLLLRMWVTVNWLIDSIRWTWLTISSVAFITAEVLAVFYLYKFLGWM